MPGLSIIVPALNEQDCLGRLLPYLRAIAPGCKIIVCDGGSADSSREVAAGFGRVISATRGRASQMNAGAQAGAGDVLWFLHADCRPHPDSVEALTRALSDPAVVGGGFEYSLDGPGLRFRAAECLSNSKNRRLGLLYGDMGIFVRRTAFVAMDGYRDIPLMEDMDFSRRLKRLGKIVILSQTMETSARRWLEEGFWTCALRTWVLQAAWAFGVSPHRLARYYRFGGMADATPEGG